MYPGASKSSWMDSGALSKHCEGAWFGFTERSQPTDVLPALCRFLKEHRQSSNHSRALAVSGKMVHCLSRGANARLHWHGSWLMRKRSGSGPLTNASGMSTAGAALAAASASAASMSSKRFRHASVSSSLCPSHFGQLGAPPCSFIFCCVMKVRRCTGASPTTDFVGFDGVFVVEISRS